MLKILSTGLTLIQDGVGREDLADVGVPISGAFDNLRLKQANYLVGNDLTDAAFEHHNGKLEFYSEIDTIVAVVSKGEVNVQSDGESRYLLRPFFVPAYAFVSIRTSYDTSGLTYIAVSGLSPDNILGSVSYDTFSKIGTPIVSVGASYSLKPKNLFSYFELENRFIAETALKERIYQIPFHEGPEFNKLSLGGSLQFKVSSVSRSGVRFDGLGNISWGSEIKEIKSRPVFPGVIQVPSGGDPIVLGPDAGVTGGYPILGVIEKDYLSVLSRLNAGDNTTFVLSAAAAKPVSLNLAQM